MPTKRTKPIPRRSRPARKRKTSLGALGRAADRVWGELVRLRGRCEMCGSRDRLQAAHGWSRRYRSTRWLPVNGFCLCSGCHKTMTHHPIAWDDYLRDAWGADVYAELRRLALTPARYTVDDLREIVAGLRREVDDAE